MKKLKNELKSVEMNLWDLYDYWDERSKKEKSKKKLKVINELKKWLLEMALPF